MSCDYVLGDSNVAPQLCNMCFDCFAQVITRRKAETSENVLLGHIPFALCELQTGLSVLQSGALV